MSKKKIYIGVGSNQGNRRENVNWAHRLLEERGITVKRVSPLYETEAVCRPGTTMPEFLNGVFEIETDLSPESLLHHLEEIERELGRKEKGNWSPRPIDLDILLYGNEIIRTNRIQVPHPEIETRWFVLKSLIDLDPNIVHPLTNKKLEEIYADLH